LLGNSRRVLERAEAELTSGASLRALDAAHLTSALTLQDDAGVRVPCITGDQQQGAGFALGLERNARNALGGSRLGAPTQRANLLDTLYGLH
jgi:hypothetical protein